jgi:hypothetical protein
VDVRIRVNLIQSPVPGRASLLRRDARKALLGLKRKRKTVNDITKRHRKTTRIA